MSELHSTRCGCRLHQHCADPGLHGAGGLIEPEAPPPCLTGERAGLVSFWNRLAAPVAVCAPSGAILYTNPPLRRLLQHGCGHLAAAVRCLAARVRHADVEEEVEGAGFRIRLYGTRIGTLTGAGCPLSAIIIDAAPAAAELDIQRAYKLTNRELEVALLLGEGASTKAIARELEVSWHTARGHIERSMRKLGVRSRAGVAATIHGRKPARHH
jgi:DNA-binding CsgD family transcriptional regulator